MAYALLFSTGAHNVAIAHPQACPQQQLDRLDGWGVAKPRHYCLADPLSPSPVSLRASVTYLRFLCVIRKVCQQCVRPCKIFELTMEEAREMRVKLGCESYEIPRGGCARLQ